MTTFPRLRTTSLTLREWRETDAPRALKLFQNQNITRMLTSKPHPFTKANAEAFLHKVMPHNLNEVLNWAVELKGEVVGGIGAGPLDKTPDMGWWLAEEHWQKGIMFEAASEALRYLLLERELPKIIADAFSDNKGSQALMRKLGFVNTGQGMGSSLARLAGTYPTEEFAISPLDFIAAQQLRVQEAAQ
ncbi:ribosomal-protein-S5-alanine N-acetyltransferase [Pseudovibrio sp. W64]|uniref:GNAT family N-acetyltransferase n=1 Tax=unclassified Pseudovibrio TaxID=2627060 RepID=UPI0007AE800C|nr:MULTISPECIES: GNAT family N-acetyltransferase [unclassified Pseudovibrio]KZK77811.1 ribosomal-protein-S5-alanine N-acetyltransferase [Pseudovibrio sp. W64]KZL27094.1 ribosomal-protein-S5-alanine N-acetyltransferase [Pseudovibrio sp. WM33]